LTGPICREFQLFFRTLHPFVGSLKAFNKPLLKVCLSVCVPTHENAQRNRATPGKARRAEYIDPQRHDPQEHYETR
jgi:hypothetical protein